MREIAVKPYHKIKKEQNTKWGSRRRSKSHKQQRKHLFKWKSPTGTEFRTKDAETYNETEWV